MDSVLIPIVNTYRCTLLQEEKEKPVASVITDIPEVTVEWTRTDDEGHYVATFTGIPEGKQLFIAGANNPAFQGVPMITVSENTVEYQFGADGLIQNYMVQVDMV